MDPKLEQRANIKFCVRLGKSASETFELLLQAYGNDAMSQMRCSEWHSHFERGRTSLEDVQDILKSLTPDLSQVNLIDDLCCKNYLVNLMNRFIAVLILFVS